MVGVKICGLSTVETVAAALEGGAERLGFMFFPASPRNISPHLAEMLARPVRGKARVVAVLVDPSDDLVDEVAGTLRPDEVQLHGKESPTRAREIGARAKAGVIKALPVSSSEDLDAASAYEGAVDHLMFDARAPAGSDRPGGTGASFDWSILAGRRFERPWFLAGGLDPWNVSDAIGQSGAPMVDVSSGVERGAGLKDPALIAAFLRAVSRA